METDSLLRPAVQKTPLRLYVIAVCACLTSLSMGVSLGYTSPAYPDMKTDNFITKNQVELEEKDNKFGTNNDASMNAGMKEFS